MKINLLTTFVIFTSILFSQNSYQVYFNEVRADDAGTDDNEFLN